MGPNIPSSDWSVISYNASRNTSYYGEVSEGATLNLICSPGQVISVIPFASYGTPDGTDCSSFAESSSCAAPTSVSVVAAACMGRNKCSIMAVRDDFGDDPCYGTSKSLAVCVTCTGLPSSIPTSVPTMGAVFTVLGGTYLDADPVQWKGDKFDGVTLQQCADMSFNKGARCAMYARSGRCNYYVTATCSQVCNRSPYCSDLKVTCCAIFVNSWAQTSLHRTGL